MRELSCCPHPYCLSYFESVILSHEVGAICTVKRLRREGFDEGLSVLGNSEQLASPAEVLELTGKPIELQRVSGGELAQAGNRPLKRRRQHAGPRCVRCRVGGVPFGI